MHSLSILLVEDNPGDARLVREGFREIKARHIELSHAESLAAAVARLDEREFDVCLVDLGLPDAKGLEVVRRIHHTAPETAIVVLTGVSDDKVAVQSLQEGAQDYLVKASVDGEGLWRATRYALERQQLQRRLLNLALVDDLTGLTNRKGFNSLASHHAKLARRTGKTFLIAFIDLDGLKYINDTWGHQEGNYALVETANVLRDSFRQSDIVARYGGDEFVVLISDADEDSAPTVLERLYAKVCIRNTQDNRRYQLSLSVGIVSSSISQRPDVTELLNLADARMYECKHRRAQVRSA